MVVVLEREHSIDSIDCNYYDSALGMDISLRCHQPHLRTIAVEMNRIGVEVAGDVRLMQKRVVWSVYRRRRWVWSVVHRTPTEEEVTKRWAVTDRNLVSRDWHWTRVGVYDRAVYLLWAYRAVTLHHRHLYLHH